MLDRGSFRGLPSEASCVSQLSTSAPGGIASSATPAGYPERGAVSSSLGSPALSAGSALASEVPLQPTVSSLRDRLLREAQLERQRCLEVAEAAERRRVEFRGLTHAGTQTDPVAFVTASPFPDASPSASRRSATSCGDVGFGLPATDLDEDAEQMEAIRALQKMEELGNESQVKEALVTELSLEVQSQRQHREATIKQLALEQTGQEAKHEQVMALENELDIREAAHLATEHLLERRTLEMQQAMQQIEAMESHGLAPATDVIFLGEEVRHLRSQLVDKDYQLELKDRYISRLQGVLRSHGIFSEGFSNNCGSEKSMALTVSTAASMGQFSIANSVR